MSKKPEILAPAGSISGLKAAVAAGCDAVYMGGSRFGARAYADNPQEEEMIEAISYCHLHGVKIYMTVNTLLKNREMENSLYDFLLPFYNAGLDAVIVQDVGVMRFISRYFPDLPIHASTQMTITQGGWMDSLKKYHVNRLVPVRELTLEELQQIRRETDLEMEVFVHGALCYCYSGQCLFSSMLGGRSGNRGRCAQPCRQAYLVDGKKHDIGGYVLSPKELCNLSYLPEMIQAGIDSFKIEGRMKRPEYTAFVTSRYRKYVDLYFEKGEEGYRNYLEENKNQWEEDIRELAEIYNRNGFTQGYLQGNAGECQKNYGGKKGNMLSSKRPKFNGVKVGRVLSVTKQEVTYETCLPLHSQDVVEFRDKKQQTEYEYTLGQGVKKGQKVKARYQKGCRIFPGDTVYRTKDAFLLDKIRKEYLQGEKQIPVQGQFYGAVGTPMKLELKAGNRSVQVVWDQNCEAAQKQPATIESVSKTLGQTGNSLFSFEKLEVTLQGELFLPVGAIKNLRRQGFEKLREKIVGQYERNNAMVYEKTAQALPSLEKQQKRYAASIMTKEQLDSVLERKEIEVIYLQTECMSAEELKEAFEKSKQAEKQAWLLMPAIFRKGMEQRFQEEFVQKGQIFSLNWDGFLVRNQESFWYLLRYGHIDPASIRLDYNMYVMNREAYGYWKEQGVDKITIPLEASEKEIEDMAYLEQGDSELLIYGKIPLMVSAQCVTANTAGCRKGNERKQNQVITIKDQRNREFECVNFCKYCYNVIFQKEVYCGIPVLQKKELPMIHRFRYGFTLETPEQIRKILAGNVEGKTNTGHLESGIE